ncbi:hypothetical protein HMPREF1870_01036 [Bacteroidales bacterium KA00344]|nr:hypothetical protein HMPREF1870_01036 [Bacteroidales bacterium KA00344]
MKNIFKSSLLLLCSFALLTSCEDDNASNPVLTTPTTFVLNTPSIAANNVIDLANSSTLELTCSQPDYGFPAVTSYTVEVATKSDMSDATALSQTFTSARMNLDVAELASTLTTLELNAGKKDSDFPMTIPVYVRAKAVMTSKTGGSVSGTSITSNVVTLNKVNLSYALPPVTLPENIYITGNFNNWSWETSLVMTPVYDTDNMFWHLVYIDGKGIKFNTSKAWDGNEVGFSKIVVNAASELGSEIIEADGNIASSKPGWYLMIVTTSVSGRDIVYDVRFNKPEVWLMGTATAGADWKELEDGAMFTVPTTADGNFESPAFANNTSGDGGVRVYVKLPDYDWWKTEFMVFDKVIKYRGKGGDQDRVQGTKGQKIYMNFTSETGEIK